MSTGIVRMDDPTLPEATTLVGLTVSGMQSGQVVRIPPSLLKGNKGDSVALTYEDLTPEQITALQQPATDMIAAVNTAIDNTEAVIDIAIDAAAAAQAEADRVSAITVLTSEEVTDVTEYTEVTI